MYVTEQIVRQHLRALGTGETDEEIATLVPDGDYFLTELEVDELDAWAYAPDKVAEYAARAGAYPAIVLVEEQLTDGNHRVCAARERGDFAIPAYVAC